MNVVGWLSIVVTSVGEWIFRIIVSIFSFELKQEVTRVAKIFETLTYLTQAQ